MPSPSAKVAAFPGHVRTTAFLQHTAGVCSSPQLIPTHGPFIHVLSRVQPRVLSCWLTHVIAGSTSLGGVNLPDAFLRCTAVAIVVGGHTLSVFHFKVGYDSNFWYSLEKHERRSQLHLTSDHSVEPEI